MAKSRVEHFVSEVTGETYSIFGHPLSDQERERRGQMTLINCPPEEDKTRQEENIHTPKAMLERYGPNFYAFNNRGSFDQELDLQRALEVRAEAKAAYDALPKKVREKYSSIFEVAAAAESGELATLMKPPADPPPASSEAKP